MISRRGLLAGLLFAPAIIRTPGLLMPVKTLVTSRMTMDQIASRMLSLMARDIQPAVIDAMVHGGPGGILTGVDEAGRVEVKFVPGSEIYMEFYA